MDINFAGKRALVTGAGKGIGRGLVALLHRCGAQVVAVSRTQQDLDELKAELPDVQVIQADLGDTAQVERVAEEAGAIDLLVNNAGVSSLAPFLEQSLAEFERIVRVNLTAVFQLSQLVCRGMVSRGKGGAVVNVSSQASVAALKDHTAYCSSKAGLDHLTRVMALELGPHNIRVNAVNPTVVLTAMGKMAWSDPAKAGPMLANIPLGRFAEVDDVTSVIAFLLSDKAGMINGVILPVDGGFLV
eukprot:m.888255 g.888255  ORF g.888255 m.888255 type:complete len:244 (-) comp59927_c0_seq3:4126-4857(-)